jgi:hypothetical protein
MNNNLYKEKYIIYKNKYLNLKKFIGGADKCEERNNFRCRIFSPNCVIDNITDKCRSKNCYDYKYKFTCTKNNRCNWNSNTDTCSPHQKPQKLTSEEFDKLVSLTNADDILNKISNSYYFKNKTNYIINAQDYDRVYVTSDIHSDYRKFVKILKDIGLIDTCINPYTDDVYKSDLVTNTKWIPEKTLFVIVGDLVDGRRNSEVADVNGSFELLLHIFLYNLRLSAHEKNSEIIFTIGNHDFHSVIKISENNISLSQITKEFLRLMTPSSLLFYNNGSNFTKNDYYKIIKNKQKFLLPFYNCSPYFFLIIRNNDVNEVILVHGGIHNSKDTNTKDIIKKLEKIQINVLKTNLNTIDDNIYDFFSNITSPLWTRFYAEELYACTKLYEQENNNNNLIIVGHCPTYSAGANNFYNIKNIMDKDKSTYINCESDGGCVTIGCFNKLDNAPRLVFVDTAMSAAFSRNPGNLHPETRRAEFLLLCHDPLLQSSRYYNVINRIASKNDIINIWPLVQLPI